MKTFEPNSNLRVGALVADVDLTIISDGHSELTGLNLEALADALQRHIPVLLISGSPYDAVYCGVKTTGSLQRRVYAPLRAELQKRGGVTHLKHLKIFYASGRGTVSFDAAGDEIRTPDRTDRDISSELQARVFRAFLAGFYAIQMDLASTDNLHPTLETIWNTDTTDLQAAALVRQLIQDEKKVDVGALEKWSFGSELALVFHHWHSSGPAITDWAKALLQKKNVELTPDFFWAGGVDYAKASRIRKRDVIREELAALKPAGTVVLFGDSNVDDFLTLPEQNHLPIFLGSSIDSANFPIAWLARNQNGQDRQQAAAFGPLLKMLLTQNRPTDFPYQLIQH